ncbi:MAG: peptidylprolyl isomerase [Synergistaceae bacterium]|nr:peptidylprolyl isomerase [Synergistaceae bacterium]
MKRKFLCVFITLMVLFSWGTSFAAEPEEDVIVAKIENEVITEKEIDKLLDNLDPQMGAMYRTPEGRAALIEEMINARLFAIKGTEEGLDKSQEFLDEIERFKKHALMKVTVDKMMENVVASDEDAKKFYDENPTQFTQPEQVRASHILVADEAEMEKVQSELKEGVAFEEVAKKYSTCPSKENGGDLGFFGKGQMVPEFEAVAFELEIGKISEPVKTQFGIHVIRLDAKNTESKIPLEEVMDQLKAYLLNQKRTEAYQEALVQLKEKYKIERITPAPEAINP